jgi:hypothetical protein
VLTKLNKALARLCDSDLVLGVVLKFARHSTTGDSLPFTFRRNLFPALSFGKSAADVQIFELPDEIFNRHPEDAVNFISGLVSNLVHSLLRPVSTLVTPFTVPLGGHRRGSVGISQLNQSSTFEFFNLEYCVCMTLHNTLLADGRIAESVLGTSSSHVGSNLNQTFKNLNEN